MMEFSCVSCPKCSATVPLSAVEGNLRCALCRTEIPNPGLPGVESEIVIQGEGVAAMHIVLQFLGLPPGNRPVFLLCFLFGPAIYSSVILYAFWNYTAGQSIFTGLFVCLISFMWLSRLNTFLINLDSRRFMHFLRQSRRVSACPGCSNPVCLPAENCGLTCTSCGQKLLHGEGLLILEKEHLENRAQAWTLRAKPLVEAYREERISASGGLSRWLLLTFSFALPFTLLFTAG